MPPGLPATTRASSTLLHLDLALRQIGQPSRAGFNAAKRIWGRGHKELWNTRFLRYMDEGPAQRQPQALALALTFDDALFRLLD